MGGCAPLGAGFLSSTMWLRPRPTSIPSGILIHPAVWLQPTWAEDRGGAVHLFGVDESPSNTMWPGPRPTSMPSVILIHPSIHPFIQPFGHNARTSQTDRTDRQTDQSGERSYSIARTVLQTVAQKRFALRYRTVDLSVLSVCDVPNDWMNQDETSHGGTTW